MKYKINNITPKIFNIFNSEIGIYDIWWDPIYKKSGICWLWDDKIAKYKNGFTEPIIRNGLWYRLVNKMSVVLGWRSLFMGQKSF